MGINQLLELHDLAKQESRKYERRRALFPDLTPHKARHFIGLIGARGTGKTVLLRQYAIEHDDAFYLSADTLDRNDDAWELILGLNRHYGFLESIIEKVISRDIPSVFRLVIDELESIRRLLRFVGRSAVDGVNYSSLSRNLGITKYKAQQYVEYLERAFILHQVFPAGTNVLREPKVLMAPPTRLLYRDLEDAVGGLREDYFGEAMKQAGIRFQYLKSTRGAKTPDYLVDDGHGQIAVEIGGRGKGREQFKGVQVNRKLVFAHSPVPEAGRLPLFLLGYLS